MRIGTKKKPFYRVVVVDERSKRTGAYIELLGTYNPLTEPKDIKLKQDRIDYWTKQGAQPSTGFLRIIGKAPQRLPRKPKKAGKQGTVENEQPKAEEPAKKAPTEEAAPEKQPTPEAPVEETAKPSESEATETPAEETEAKPETQESTEPEKSESNQEENK